MHFARTAHLRVKTTLGLGLTPCCCWLGCRVCSLILSAQAETLVVPLQSCDQGLVQYAITVLWSGPCSVCHGLRSAPIGGISGYRGGMFDGYNLLRYSAV
jgi:hypothetical protein